MILVRKSAIAISGLSSFLSKVAAIAAAVFLVAMICHTLVEIVLRSFFDKSTFALDEFIGYGMAAVTTLGSAHALETGNLIRVKLLVSRLERWPMIRKAVEVACCLLAGFLLAFIASYFWKSLSRNYDRGTVSETVTATPLWIPETLVLLGLAVLALRFLGLALEEVWPDSSRPSRRSVDNINMQGV